MTSGFTQFFLIHAIKIARISSIGKILNVVVLGFDASKDFHRYSIEWSPTWIRWLVDDHLACQRANWDPTPVPHLPMQFFVNLWHPRSEELAGKLFDRDLPAHSEIKSIDIQYVKASGSLRENGH